MTLKNAKGKTITIVDEYEDIKNTVIGSNANATLMNITDADNSPIVADPDAIKINASSRKKAVDITGNSKNNSIIGGQGDDTLYGEKGNDTLTGGAGNDVFVFTPYYDNTTITDYTPREDRIFIDYDTITMSSLSGNDVVFKATNYSDSLIIKNGKGKKIIIDDEEGNHIETVIGSADNDFTYNTNKTVLTLASSYKGTLKTSDYDATVKTINGSKTNNKVYIIGNTQANSIIGGKGADTINGGKGNDTLTGGNGKDVFMYATGDDKDVIMIFNDGKILTVKNAKDKNIKFVDSTGAVDDKNTKKYIDVTELVLKLTDKGKFDVTSDSDVLIIDASKTKNGVEIIANSNNNTIIGSKGNDTLTGGAGDDTFSYTSGGGNDTITDYNINSDDENDIIYLGKKTYITDAEIIDDNYVFTIGKNKLTIKDGADKTITFKDYRNNTIKYEGERSSDKESAFIEKLDEAIFADDNFAQNDIDSMIDEPAAKVLSINNLDCDTNSNLLNNSKEIQIQLTKMRRKAPSFSYGDVSR